MMKAIAFAFLYSVSLWTVYWRGWARGTRYTMRQIISNLVKYQGMAEDNAIKYVMQIAAPEREENENV